MEENFDIEVKYIGDEPKYMSDHAAGADVAVDGDHVIKAGERLLIPTKLKLEMPENVFCMLTPRSSLCKSLQMTNSIGIIDADYRGTLMFSYRNVSDEDKVIQDGERLGQLIFLPRLVAKFAKVDSLSESARGEGGFGSTGKS